MTATEAGARPAASISPALFAVTVFASAGLVFMVQPMVAKLVLPLLGGSPSVWNTSMAFFQAALLAGYGYAHLLQRVRSVRRQAVVHTIALIVAALALPLRVSELAGPPSSEQPSLWLLGVLAISIGAPFAVLSATAPLVQAWHARVFRAEGGPEPYVLYAASNLGSLIALLAYPILVEPTTTLQGQRLGWSLGYAAFVLLMGGLAYLVSRTAQDGPAQMAAEPAAPPVSWRQRLAWVALAAIPSSLMLGVTTHITTDVASAPFLWVVPLALYLGTFIIAFSEKPVISPPIGLILHAIAVAACAAMLPFKTSNFLAQMAVHLAAFFFTALVCHQRLVSLRPPPARLTEFYLCMSLGGVVGGAFNAFAAPVIFNNVYEYPLMLVLGCLARPWGGRIAFWRWFVFLVGIAAAYAAGIVVQSEGFDDNVKLLLGVVALCAVINSPRGLLFFALIAAISVAAELVGDRVDTRQSWRSFFGVLRQSQMPVPGVGVVKMLSHGTTMHGAQATNPDYDCRPFTYYALETPIGQVFLAGREKPHPLTIGAVGLGTGAVSAYTRPGDVLTFYEIDPLVKRIATDPKNFTYISSCSEGRIGYVIGDARLTLQNEPRDKFDILLIDAFSSDAVPAHLLTVEAARGYLERLKPDGVLILHLSNRNLSLAEPAAAVVKAAGAHGLHQTFIHDPSVPHMWASSVEAMIVAKTPAGLAPFRNDPKWTAIDDGGVRPWTDDYTNLPGALYDQMKSRMDWLP
ncbi:fused MFS/spermidine synthase [Phenylobacterium sp.]|jgi:SAM-dependent methyltransferase|uniref:spermidine synthase n=1 Tax=Phenylobacterium sp. TaxID=1871053 RepID=UPI002E34499D|nr:fused MFS/spermidine synthase [Phenylobacterium sp.]HEX2560094.1 fused MFS/spermidine synthase [Phenylobacterium sp.]